MLDLASSTDRDYAYVLSCSPLLAVSWCVQAFVMILAAYETTANALGFTLYLLAGHPECQSRLAAEVDAVLGSSKRPGYQDLESLPYMDACLREALRCALPDRLCNAGRQLLSSSGPEFATSCRWPSCMFACCTRRLAWDHPSHA